MQGDNREDAITHKAVGFFYKVLAGERTPIYFFKVRVIAYLDYCSGSGLSYTLNDDSFEVGNRIVDMINVYQLRSKEWQK